MDPIQSQVLKNGEFFPDEVRERFDENRRRRGASEYEVLDPPLLVC